MAFFARSLKVDCAPSPEKIHIYTFNLYRSIVWLIGSLSTISWNIYFLVIALNYFTLDMKEGDGDIYFHRRSPN